MGGRRRSLASRAGSGPRDSAREVLRADHAVLAEHGCAFDGVLQLPHIAGPRIGSQVVERGGVESQPGDAQPAAVFSTRWRANEMMSSRRWRSGGTSISITPSR